MFKDPLAMHSIASICHIIYSVTNQENPLPRNKTKQRRHHNEHVHKKRPKLQKRCEPMPQAFVSFVFIAYF